MIFERNEVDAIKLKLNPTGNKLKTVVRPAECVWYALYTCIGYVGGTVDRKSALRPAVTLLSQTRTPPLAVWPDGVPNSLRSPLCGRTIYKNQTQYKSVVLPPQCKKLFGLYSRELIKGNQKKSVSQCYGNPMLSRLVAPTLYKDVTMQGHNDSTLFGRYFEHGATEIEAEHY
ncbi:hypothetical protein PoB_003754200 [Plakobranchus ocellatus]|uniref:Uncharacterized protein n=1 Tax=Plakobranchus ocellatus TaxID=259542 RepID=A0AAV4AVK7_9GAST|nr:hypothetical protein PoB_003754200 [Plakobranchus ocellatus]